MIVALQPSDFHVVRTTSIAAPMPDVVTQVNDFHKWEAWSPWAKLDPAAKASFEGPPSGVGAVFKWAGNDKIGEGRMTLIESSPSRENGPRHVIRIKVEFTKPFEGGNEFVFTVRPEGGETAVMWAMAIHNNFIAKAVCLFVSMDRMLGGDMEKGLAQMKTVAEAAGRKS